MIHLIGFIRRMMVIFLRQYFARKKLPAHGEQSLSRMPRTPNARMSVPCRMPHAPLNGPPLTAHLTRSKLCSGKFALFATRAVSRLPNPNQNTCSQRHSAIAAMNAECGRGARRAATAVSAVCVRHAVRVV